MKKHTLKYVINVSLFINISTVAVLGFLLGFVIPRGQGRRGATFLGLHRHDWGDLHLYLSILLLILLAVHLILNLQWIVSCSRRYFGRNWKNALWCISGAWLIILVSVWFIALI